MPYRKLKAFRKRSGMSVTELCEKMKINGPSYRRYERGEVSPKIELCIEICKAFDCTLDDIWGEETATPEQVDVTYRAKPGQTVYLKIDVDDAINDKEHYQTPIKVRPRKKESKAKNSA